MFSKYKKGAPAPKKAQAPTQPANTPPTPTEVKPADDRPQTVLRRPMQKAAAALIFKHILLQGVQVPMVPDHGLKPVDIFLIGCLGRQIFRFQWIFLQIEKQRRIIGAMNILEIALLNYYSLLMILYLPSCDFIIKVT